MSDQSSMFPLQLCEVVAEVIKKIANYRGIDVKKIYEDGCYQLNLETTEFIEKLFNNQINITVQTMYKYQFELLETPSYPDFMEC